MGSLGTTFTLVNRCDYTVWPGILSNAGSSGLDTTGFQLQPGATRSFQAQPGWSGRFWGRTGCSFDPATGQGSCATGDCGSNQMECNGGGATPPATLAEFTIGSGAAQDFYDVSLVDGYNLPMLIETAGGSGGCGSTGCVTDLNPGRTVAGYVPPSMYSEIFKNACPKSYSYAYDDATSTFTCSGADYTITFCPSHTSQKSSRDSSPPAMAAGTTSGLPPPATATNPADGSSSQAQYNNLPPWLPNFVAGGSLGMNPNDLISATTLILSSISILLQL
ncbi:UNVERIFIED_CONTAM: Thaumatin-like protein 1 [Sesamum latifolium]|uniref:Thaumatin-like protein 1 n=1 Tax=Sesamum latifolium TaxID=2727402 RepID=A0AAW2VTI4_9LAMI